MVPGSVGAAVEVDFRERPVAVGRRQDEDDARAVAAEQGEVDATSHRGGAEGQGAAPRDAQARHGRLVLDPGSSRRAAGRRNHTIRIGPATGEPLAAPGRISQDVLA